MAGVGPETARNTSIAGYGRFLQLHTKSHLFVSLWTTSGVYGLTAAMLTAIILAVTYECVNEYLIYLRNRALQRKQGSQCCGVPVISCCEKFAQAFVYVIRALIGYLLMLCVMTMNIWLLIAVTIGSTVGFGVGKPLVANAIRDIISSYEYNLAPVNLTHGKANKSQRSMSWRYRPMETIDRDSLRLREEIELLTTVSALDSTQDDVFRNGELSSHAEIIWLRRSETELANIANDTTLYEDDVELRHKDNTNVGPKIDTIDAWKMANTSLERTPGRFKSTSKVINASMRSSRSDSYRESLSRQSAFGSLDRTDSRHSSARNSPMNSPGRPDRRNRILRNESNASRVSGSVSLNRSTSGSSSRFKPVSRQISKDRNVSGIPRLGWELDTTV